ncbi:MAG: winged helix-turn-helix transcriptional regulator [Janthinobacterium lividum]
MPGANTSRTGCAGFYQWERENADSDLPDARQSALQEIQTSIPNINPKVLSKELRDLEEHQLIKRMVHNEYPVLIEYVVTEYAQSLKKVLLELHAWGAAHRQKILGN